MSHTIKPGTEPDDGIMTLAERREPLRVGLVGFGLGGSTFHAPLVAATPGLELTAIATSNPERVEKARARYPSAQVVPSPDAFWSMTPKLDLVVVSTPHATHAPIASAALASGSHVVVDKPFALTSQEARDLAALAKQHGKLAIPFQNRRWDNEIRTLQMLMREGTLGDIHRFESRYERWRPMPKARWTEPGAGDRGEGVLGDLTVHLVDQALMLFGPARSVYAEFERRHPQVHVVDDVFVAIRHKSGVLSHLFTSPNVAILGPRLTVLGSKGAYVKHGIDPQEEALLAGGIPGSPGWGEEPETSWGRVGAGDDVRALRSEPGNYLEFYAGVEAAIRNGATPPVTTEQGVAMMELLDAARLSAEDRRVVTLGA
ncbi:MAG: Gfo/Idh/MocA family oxidoreductase [Gemmatimonadaceae bacterium]